MTLSARTSLVTILCAFVTAISGCGGEGKTANPSRPTATVTVTATPSPSAAATPTNAGLATAGEYAHAIARRVRSTRRVTVLTEKTDSNNLLGRPNGYVSAAVITDVGGDTSDSDPGVSYGATVEMFDSKSSAVRRSDYIQGILKDSPMLGTEYDYVRGKVLLRVSGELPPSVAAKYKAAFATADS